MLKHIVFDLDGTLVDSAPGILRSLAYAFETQALQPLVPITPQVIGPPLHETIAHLSGSSDPVTIRDCADRFKAHYDQEGLLATMPYTGILELLQALDAGGARLHVATNKRQEPARKILKHLGWETFFASVYGIDTPPGFSSKTMLLKALLEHEGCPPEHTVYIGDKLADHTAATSHGVHFVGVQWGYGDAQELAGLPTVPDCHELLAYLQGWQRQASTTHSTAASSRT